MRSTQSLAPAPDPVQVPVRPIVIGGSVLFAIAAVIIALVPDAREAQDGLWLWTCVSGAALGVLGLGLMRWQKAS